MESAAFEVIVGEPRFTPGGKPRGTILDAGDPNFLEIKGGTSELRDNYQQRLQLFFSLKEEVPFTLETSRPVEPRFEDFLRRFGTMIETPEK